MEPHKQVIFDEEAAVDALAKGYFCDKTLIDKKLFKINKDAQNTLKPPQKPPKGGDKKNFHFGNFPLSNRQKLGILRKKDRLKKIDSG